jgi:hypothetical protein
MRANERAAEIGDGWAEFAGDEGVQAAEAGGELGSAQAAVVVEMVEIAFRG